MVPMEEFKSIPPPSTNSNLSYKEMTTIQPLKKIAFLQKYFHQKFTLQKILKTKLYDFNSFKSMTLHKQYLDIVWK
jgi:hypothetical protein